MKGKNWKGINESTESYVQTNIEKIINRAFSITDRENKPMRIEKEKPRKTATTWSRVWQGVWNPPGCCREISLNFDKLLKAFTNEENCFSWHLLCNQRNHSIMKKYAMTHIEKNCYKLEPHILAENKQPENQKKLSWLHGTRWRVLYTFTKWPIQNVNITHK